MPKPINHESDIMVQIFGSSHISGEGGTDFQEEVVGVPEAAGHAFDDLDAVVDAFEHAGMQRVATMGQDAPGGRTSGAGRTA